MTDRPMRVILAARPSERLDAAKAQVEKLGCAVETIDFDARAVDTHADVIRKAFASGDVDVAVVAFGLLGDAEKAWTDVDAAVELATVNYTAAVRWAWAVERMREQSHGAIVVVVGRWRARGGRTSSTAPPRPASSLYTG